MVCFDRMISSFLIEQQTNPGFVDSSLQLTTASTNFEARSLMGTSLDKEQRLIGFGLRLVEEVAVHLVAEVTLPNECFSLDY